MRGRLRLVLLGAWIGALATFALLMVPAAFRTLPGTELAAQLVGATLAPLDRLGIGLGLAAWLLASGDGPGRGISSPRALLPVVGVILHSISLFWLAPEIREIREAAGGSVVQLGVADPELDRFGRLHVLSVALVALEGASAALAVAWDILSGRAEKSA